MYSYELRTRSNVNKTDDLPVSACKKKTYRYLWRVTYESKHVIGCVCCVAIGKTLVYLFNYVYLKENKLKREFFLFCQFNYLRPKRSWF